MFCLALVAVFGFLEFYSVFFCCCCCLVLKTFKVVFGIRIYAVWGGERCKTFVTINWFSGMADRVL